MENPHNDNVLPLHETESMTPDVNETNPHENEGPVLSVIVFDLAHSQALLACAEMAKDLKEVNEGLKIAQEVGMRLVFVAMNRKERVVTCVPVANEHTIPSALEALSGAIDASEHSVAWVMLPQELAPILTPHLERLQERWEKSTQGVIA
jgi:hypothetical protein